MDFVSCFFIYMEINLPITWKVGSVLSSWATTGFSKGILFHKTRYFNTHETTFDTKNAKIRPPSSSSSSSRTLPYDIFIFPPTESSSDSAVQFFLFKGPVFSRSLTVISKLPSSSSSSRRFYIFFNLLFLKVFY